VVRVPHRIHFMNVVCHLVDLACGPAEAGHYVLIWHARIAARSPRAESYVT